MSQNPPVGGEMDPSTVRIDTPAGGTIGYAWYQSKSKAYYVMAAGHGIPLKAADTNTYTKQNGFNGSTPAAFLTWAAGKLGVAESKVDKQFLVINYSPWP